MAAPPGEQPWTNAEKNYLLAEVIKHLNPPPNYLFNLVSSLLGGQHPIWNDIPLPPGRSLNSSRGAFENLRRAASMQSMPTPIMPAMGPQSTSPMSAQLSLKRPFTIEPSGAYPAGREIRPKPSSIGSPYGQQSPHEGPPKKKRGRPTKAEAQARAEAQGGSGEPGPAPRPQMIETPVARPSIIQPPEPSSMESPRSEDTRPLPGPGMSILSMLTPIAQKSTSQSSSSSGKRKRGKSTIIEPEDLAQTEEPGAAQTQQYESPYPTRGVEAQDSPARTAIRRHRDEPGTIPGAQQSGAAGSPPPTEPPTTT